MNNSEKIDGGDNQNNNFDAWKDVADTPFTPQLADLPVKQSGVSEGFVQTPQLADLPVKQSGVSEGFVQTPQLADLPVKQSGASEGFVQTPQLADLPAKESQFDKNHNS